MNNRNCSGILSGNPSGVSPMNSEIASYIWFDSVTSFVFSNKAVMKAPKRKSPFSGVASGDLNQSRTWESDGGKPVQRGNNISEVNSDTKALHNRPDSSCRRLRGITKWVLENSSIRRDFPIPDDCTIAKIRA